MSKPVQAPGRSLNRRLVDSLKAHEVLVMSADVIKVLVKMEGELPKLLSLFDGFTKDKRDQNDAADDFFERFMKVNIPDEKYRWVMAVALIVYCYRGTLAKDDKKKASLDEAYAFVVQLLASCGPEPSSFSEKDVVNTLIKPAFNLVQTHIFMAQGVSVEIYAHTWAAAYIFLKFVLKVEVSAAKLYRARVYINRLANPYTAAKTASQHTQKEMFEKLVNKERQLKMPEVIVKHQVEHMLLSITSMSIRDKACEGYIAKVPTPEEKGTKMSGAEGYLLTTTNVIMIDLKDVHQVIESLRAHFS